MEFLPMIIQAVSGAVGGNLIGGLASKLSMGGLGNTIMGAIGGGGGGALMGMLAGGATGDPAAAATAAADAASAAGGMDMSSILQSVGVGAAGGGVLTGVGGMLKGMMGGGNA